MKSEHNILIAFLLNLFFAIFEFVGGIITNSVAIASDAIHDLGDSLCIGVSYLLERKSKNKPDNKYTYGYARFSILGALITSLVLVIGSIFVIGSSILRIMSPEEINYDGMIIFAIIGVIVNTISVLKTKDGDSLNQKSVSLHMLEDVLGWIVVLIGSILMRFFDINILDSIMSIGIAIFLLFHAFRNVKEIMDLFLIKLPKNVNISEIKKEIESIPGVYEIHHVHIWSIDGNENCATMHVIAKSKDLVELKKEIKETLEHKNINHSILEFEDIDENCHEKTCEGAKGEHEHHQHHHH